METMKIVEKLCLQKENDEEDSDKDNTIYTNNPDEENDRRMFNNFENNSQQENELDEIDDNETYYAPVLNDMSNNPGYEETEKERKKREKKERKEREKLRKQGWSQREIANYMGLSNEEKRIARRDRRVRKSLQKQGYSKDYINGYINRLPPSMNKAAVAKIGFVTGAKTLGKGASFAGRGLVRTVGTIGGGIVGLSAAATTGDFSKAFQYTAAGAIAGNLMGKNVNNLAGRVANAAMNVPGKINRMNNKLDNMEDRWNTDVYGPSYARQQRMDRQNQQARSRMLSSKTERSKAVMQSETLKSSLSSD